MLGLAIYCEINTEDRDRNQLRWIAITSLITNCNSGVSIRSICRLFRSWKEKKHQIVILMSVIQNLWSTELFCGHHETISKKKNSHYKKKHLWRQYLVTSLSTYKSACAWVYMCVNVRVVIYMYWCVSMYLGLSLSVLDLDAYSKDTCIFRGTPIQVPTHTNMSVWIKTRWKFCADVGTSQSYYVYICTWCGWV